MKILGTICNSKTFINPLDTAELWVSPHRERSIALYGDLENSCICCGKPVKGEGLLIHMNTDWLAVKAHISQEDCLEKTGAESQGFFRIGTDCAKRMKGFTKA